ncbi:TlpA family protein disulfide reductase [Muricauda sp. 2012CJ35-5]|uniref:TlpA family protein disulfide reductase n=1 Tax=Flagellimonas spongiicola TaxID=2942208 RepID=A0ABT0PUU5_9FLAO|nr:TlpA disulfide reductase family protein [Allomuricauda spongiicola]MCL6275165.1 TlpA family protein disulfide reductase [Allomuricauda spongiicola]
MKTIKIYALIGILMMGCNTSQEPENVFNFSIESKEITSITISKFDFEQEKMKEWKTANDLTVQTSWEVSEPFLEPGLYGIKLGSGNGIQIAVEQAGIINVKLDDDIKVESEIASVLNFGKDIEVLNQQFFAGMIAEFDEAMADKDMERLAELEKEKDAALLKFIVALEGAVRDLGPTAKAYDAMTYLDLYKNNAFFKEMLGKYEANHPNTAMTLSLKKKITKADELAVGGKLSDFKMKTRQNADISLSDYRGSYLLVDFWASWCRPCRVENPKLMQILEEDENMEFQIIGVSIDEDMAAWEKAIEKDGIKWPQILDTDHTLYKQYMLSSLPANFLLDKEGTIIAKNITALELKEKLESFN